MYVCTCNAQTHDDLEDSVRDGNRDIDSLRIHTGIGDCCGVCLPFAQDCLKAALQDLSTPESSG
jgi:bacterioferritin-associated ferredoxin